jgi:hypothetical protein
MKKCKHKVGQLKHAVEGCDYCASQLPEMFTPPQEAEEWVAKIPMLEHSHNCVYFTDDRVCDCARYKRQRELFLLVRSLLQEQKEKDRQSFKEALGEMESLTDDIKEVSNALSIQELNMEKVRSTVRKSIRNAFRQEVLTKIGEV